MAATLSPPPDTRHFDNSRRPRSQPHSDYNQSPRPSKKSPNRIKAKPANPAIINGILESLDTLPSPPIDISEENDYLDAKSTRERPHSSEGTIRSFSSIVSSTSPGAGVQYPNTTPIREDENNLSDAALPPTVHTSRPPSGLSHYNAPRTASFTGSTGRSFKRTPSIGSRRSSYSTASKEKGSVSKNKLSAQSWVMQNSMSRESVETEGSSTKSPRSLRRMNSRDTLRPPKTRIELVPQAAEPPFVGTVSTSKTRIELVPPATEPAFTSRAEKIIAKVSTPRSTSKGRLYLTDSGSNEDQSGLDSPGPIDESPELEDSPQAPAQEPVEDLRSSVRRSPPRNIIADSIPMRTSSLRQSQSTSPAPSKKRERKSKRERDSSRKPESKVDSVMETNSKSIPESSWADLGEDDGTVKRIRELQERRRSRQLDNRSSIPPEITMLPEIVAKQSEPNYTSKPEPAVFRPEPLVRRKSDERKREMQDIRPRPSASRASTEPPSKAHRLLGITGDERPSVELSPRLTNGYRSTSFSPDTNRRQVMPFEEKKIVVRPTSKSSTSPTPPLSLDYSYAEAVDALHGIERELKIEKEQRRDHYLRTSSQISRLDETPTRVSVHIPPLDEQVPRGSTQIRRSSIATETPGFTAPVRQPSTKSHVTPRKLEKRWTNHPDLPNEFEKKRNRRKSTGDARHTRQAEPEPEMPVPKRDSIEVGVAEYLQNSRLSRKIKHPLTGRTIAFSEVGDPNGAAVFVCLGMGLTRYVSAFYDELATTLRLRLITIDRPGVGGSEAYPPTDRSGPLSWPDDVLAVCQNLGVHKFSMLAHSAGAIYALATALILPHLIKGKLHLLAPWIPPSQLEAISHPTASAAPAGALPRSQRLLRVLPTPFLKAANSSFMTATSASLKPTKRRSGGPRVEPRQSSTPPSRNGSERPATGDRPSTDFHRRESMMLMDQFMPELNQMENFPIAVVQEEQVNFQANRSSLIMSATSGPMDPSFEYAANALNAAEHTEKERKTEYTSRLTARTWELAVKDSNPATDLLVCLERHRDVGFRYTDVNREVVITHGSEDKRVPLANVKWLAEQMNRHAGGGAENQFGDYAIPQSREGWDMGSSAKGGCEIRILDGEGHGLMASPLIMGDILTEIAGYWTGPAKSRTAH